jgi:hypothetical protein
MYLDTSHIFSHQKLIPYGHDPTFEFTEGLFLSGYLLLATYHLPFPLPPMTTTTTYHILLAIRRLRPDTRVINLSIATSFDLHVNKEKLLLGCEPIQWYYNIISDWPRGSSEGGRNLPKPQGLVANAPLLIVTLSHRHFLTHTHPYCRIIRSDPSTFIAAVTMSKSTPTDSSSFSSNLQSIFETSLKEYEKKTEKSLVTHPLMARLQACNSPTDILAVLRSQAEKVEQTMSADDKLIKWLEPIVNVLSVSSSVISAGVGVVNTIQMVLPRSNL